MAVNYDMAALLDTLIAEGADRIEVQSGSQPKIIGIRSDYGAQVGIVDVAALTAQEATELLRGIASPERMREFEVCGSTRFIHVHSARFGPRRIRVTGEMHHGRISIHIENLGSVDS